jgi:SAM-dependent methyltransferase
MTYWIGLPVLDIGCVDSLLLHEIKHRGYRAFGMDIRDYNSKLPKDITFIKHDILKPYEPEHKFLYIIATSVIELLGCGIYGENVIENADRIALENIHSMLHDDGYFIMSLPIGNWKGRGSRAYDLATLHHLIQGLFYPFEVTQRGGHICAVFVKILKKT